MEGTHRSNLALIPVCKDATVPTSSVMVSGVVNAAPYRGYLRVRWTVQENDCICGIKKSMTASFDAQTALVVDGTEMRIITSACDTAEFPAVIGPLLLTGYWPSDYVEFFYVTDICQLAE